MVKRLALSTSALLKETWEIYWVLIKVMIPVMILVKIGTDLGAVEWIANVFAPVMVFVGLPGEMSIVWASALLINIYAAAGALLILLPTTPLTAAEMTVLCTMMLVAHSIPIEQRIVQLAGPSFWFTSVLRIVSAVILGVILFHAYNAFGMLQDPVNIVWLPATDADASWQTWIIDSLQSLATIFVILLVLMVLLKVMEKLGITDFLGRLLGPALRKIGIGESAVPLTMSGLLLGLSYGGALVIKEARAGHMSRRDIFLSLCLLCLCHSIIEDTLFVMALGADITGVLFARLIFSILIVGALAWAIKSIPEPTFEKYLCKMRQA